MSKIVLLLLFIITIIEKMSQSTVDIKLNPSYEQLRSFIVSIPQIFEEQGETIYTGRNLIKVMEVDGVRLNVKRYKVPNIINRVAYSFVRKSKGLRAFQYPMLLHRKGVESPDPVAYIEEKKKGMIATTYFISIQSPYRHTLYHLGNDKANQNEELIREFARFTAKLHELEIYHRDYSPGNILYDKLEDGYHFSLVDINRMDFGKVDIKKGCDNFARLWGETAMFEMIAEEYAKARCFDFSLCRKLVLSSRKEFWSKYRKRHEVKFNIDI